MLLWLIVLAACTPSTHSPDGVARAFVDRLFVEADLRAALLLTEGPARAKVEAELRLLGDQPASDGHERPRVFYRQLDRQAAADAVTFYFRLTVVVVDDQPIEPEVIVRVRPSDNEWRVSNYELLPAKSGTPPAASMLDELKRRHDA